MTTSAPSHQPSGDGLPPSQEFVAALADELVSLHRELLTLMAAVRLEDSPQNEGAEHVTVLAPSPAQRHASLELLERYRLWFNKVRPFLERSPIAPTSSFDEAFSILSSYFALRRLGTGITHGIWRELFEYESAGLVRHQLALLDAARECFALLDPHERKRLEDLVIRFVPVEGRRYRVFAESRRGEATGEMELPFDARDVENFILRHCDSARGAVRGWAPASIRPYASFGESLFGALFTGGVRDLYMRHVAAISADDAGLRLRLKLGATPWLAGVPWEFLHDGTDFLALSGRVNVTRHIDSERPVRPLTITGQLRVAVTVSAPSDQSALDTTAEVERLRVALAPLIAAGLVRLDVAPNGTIATLAAMLRSAEAAGRPFHAWHFIGHGRYVEAEGMTFLAFENADGTTHLHSGFELGTLLGAHPALRVAVLNACEAARAAPEDSLTSVGAALVSRGLPAVVAMQFSITDSAAICFADDFYRSLADTGSLDAALQDARRSIFFMPNESEWATPVVMFRTDDGTLFEIQRPNLALVRGGRAESSGPTAPSAPSRS